MFVFYEKGNRHKHISPDVFVALGVPKDKSREHFLIWEGQSADSLGAGDKTFERHYSLQLAN